MKDNNEKKYCPTTIFNKGTYSKHWKTSCVMIRNVSKLTYYKKLSNHFEKKSEKRYFTLIS